MYYVNNEWITGSNVMSFSEWILWCQIKCHDIESRITKEYVFPV
jgi:hypothetical protein